MQQAANNGKLSKSIVQEDFEDYFHKIVRFPRDKYHILLVHKLNPVIHPPPTVPVHILPFSKAEVNKMIQSDIITEVTERPIRSTP